MCAKVLQPTQIGHHLLPLQTARLTVCLEDSQWSRCTFHQRQVCPIHVLRCAVADSFPATRFWMRYNIAEAATHSEWFYFKLFMNGRHITSWGTNAKTKPSGQVMRGLFEPSDRWNYKYEGTVFRNMGTEARPFIFGYENKERSAAKDGGLIEVMVFRARGRKRKLPKPTDFKNQEDYGIM